MLNNSIRIVEFYLKNYAPLYNTSGLYEFHFNKRDSINNVIIIVGGNGSGKTFLMTELSPEPLEHIENRTSNRFLENKEGCKRLHYQTEDGLEYVCNILYSADKKKTTCFFTKINLSTGESVELNPNGNVSSYTELCKTYLNYDKSYKNIGYISKDVKNIVSMSFLERQVLLSKWLPDTEMFLNASKTAQRKRNQTIKEIEGLLKDISDISINEYKNKLEILKDTLISKEKRLKEIRDVISKSELILSSLEKYSLSDYKNKLKIFKNNHKQYEEAYTKHILSTKKYKEYCYSENGVFKLTERINSLKIEISQLTSKLDNINNDITKLNLSIDSIKVNVESSNNFDKSISIVNITNDLSTIEKDLMDVDSNISDSVYENDWLSEVEYNENLKEAIKIIMSTLHNICLVSSKISGSLYDFKLVDLFKEGEANVIYRIEKRISTLKDTNISLTQSIETLGEQIIEIERASVDPVFKSFIPESCNENNCKLVKELLLKINKNNDITEIKKKIDLYNKDIESNNHIIERSILEIEQVKHILKDIAQVNDYLKNIEDKIVLLPKTIIDLINRKDPSYVLDNVDSILDNVKILDEFVSLLYKKECSKKTLDNLNNMSIILTHKDSLSNQLKILIDEKNDCIEERKNLSNIFSSKKEELDSLLKLNETISYLRQTTLELRNTYNNLTVEKNNLFSINEKMFNKRNLIYFLKTLKKTECNLEEDLINIKNDIEKHNSFINSRDTLEKRKNNLEIKKEIYDILYQTWNPRTGYPSMLIKDFLDETKEATNNDLDRVWGGIIRIEDFILNENEFRIPIRINGVVFKDVSECSTAEKSTIGLAISFGIIEVSTEQRLYNIVRIDEADGGYDTSRRKSYLETVTNRLNSINCKDVYIITHNNNFESIEADVILLKNAEEVTISSSLTNKNVIYDYNKEVDKAYGRKERIE